MGTGIELFELKKDGTEFPVEVSLANYVSGSENYTIAFINDISIRKNALDAVKRMKDDLEILVEARTLDLNNTLLELEVSRNKLSQLNAFQKALLDNATAIIISVDSDGIIQTFNREAERKLGYTAEELVGKQTPLYFHDPFFVSKRAKEFSREQRRNVPEDIETFFSTIRSGGQNEGEWVYIRKDGSKFPVQLNINSMKDEAGNVNGFVGVAFDISKTKRIESELQQALDKEKELGELKSRFVSMASHKFRTPLSTIRSSAYLIEKYNTTGEQSKRDKHLQRILSAVKMLTDILDDFLSVGKIEEGKIQVRLTRFNIRELLISTIDSVRDNCKRWQQIEYFHEGATDVRLDPSLLRHIIMNLISNASKFSPETGMISIKTTCHDSLVVLSVKDEGIGISPQDQEHLAERFFRGSNAGTIQGAGLVLHIVSKYTELMNGTVACKSELYKGSEFTVAFVLNKLT